MIKRLLNHILSLSDMRSRHRSHEVEVIYKSFLSSCPLLDLSNDQLEIPNDRVLPIISNIRNARVKTTFAVKRQDVLLFILLAFVLLISILSVFKILEHP